MFPCSPQGKSGNQCVSLTLPVSDPLPLPPRAQCSLNNCYLAITPAPRLPLAGVELLPCSLSLSVFAMTMRVSVTALNRRRSEGPSTSHMTFMSCMGIVHNAVLRATFSLADGLRRPHFCFAPDTSSEMLAENLWELSGSCWAIRMPYKLELGGL